MDSDDNQLKECFQSCKSCNKGGDETNHNCIQCADGYIFLTELNYKNCYIKCNYYYYFDQSNAYYCNQTCPINYNKIIEKKKCINDCKKDDTFKYEYNNTCYQKCPNGTYLLECNKDNLCYNNTPIGYYFDHDYKIYKRCYETCSECDKGGSESNNNCLECKSGFKFYINLLNISNCYSN